MDYFQRETEKVAWKNNSGHLFPVTEVIQFRSGDVSGD
jgi:hypothetical protein